MGQIMYPANGVRDLAGYGRTPPHPRWPNDARLALNFVLNIEEGSEYSIENGDGFSEASLTEMGESPVPRGQRDLAAESMFEFGSRVGIWRILGLFAARNLPLKAFACATVLERLPAGRDMTFAVMAGAGWSTISYLRMRSAGISLWPWKASAVQWARHPRAGIAGTGRA
jgi:hypothetical protein